MSRYLRGRQTEHDAVAALEADGYLVIRASSSKGMWDVVGVRHDRVLLVSCKRTSTEALARETLTRERRKLRALAHLLPPEATQAIWIWVLRHGWHTQEEL